MGRVVEVVQPEAVEIVAAGVVGQDGAQVVPLVLGDEQRPPPRRAPFVRRFAQFPQDVNLAFVVHLIRSVQAKAVDVVLVQPVERVIDEEAAHPAAIRAVEVDRVAPGGLVAAGEVVGRVPAQVVAVRPQMVVDDVQDDAEAAGVRGVHQATQRLRAAVDAAGREEIDAVVAPVALARELGHRHQLQRRHAQRAQRIEPFDQRVERAFRRVGADVALVDDQRLRIEAAPASVAPAERGRIDDLRGAMHALRLAARIGVGVAPLLVQVIAVERVRREGDFGVPDAVVVARQRVADDATPRRVNLGRDGACGRRPDAEAHAFALDDLGAHLELPALPRHIGESVAHGVSSGVGSREEPKGATGRTR